MSSSQMVKSPEYATFRLNPMMRIGILATFLTVPSLILIGYYGHVRGLDFDASPLFINLNIFFSVFIILVFFIYNFKWTFTNTDISEGHELSLFSKIFWKKNKVIPIQNINRILYEETRSKNGTTASFIIEGISKDGDSIKISFNTMCLNYKKALRILITNYGIDKLNKWTRCAIEDLEIL